MTIKVHGDRSLKTLRGLATRPTPSKVREAIFNIWQGKVAGANWLDLCAGSGAMGAEALLRGAACVIGVELSGAACRVIQQNWQAIAQPDQIHKIYKGDAVKILPKLKSYQFDLVYFDPPYQSDLYEPLLGSISGLLSAEAIVAAEHNRTRSLPDQIGGLCVSDRRSYGQTAITFYQHLPECEQ
ncbi:16S rRNA (guanine(966)-N(2))-methyltransferase RsmD [Tumidithrix helvetica PCC 7403]|uniref:16S rRNA (guanine(966)-N(2))-methyltransferase RsmD n=1 Tax=Tumidithrix helvetica TaxID=3457545 RepID=UPI003CA0664C